MSDLLARLEQALTDAEATAQAASDCGEAWTFNDYGGEPHLITGSHSDGHGNNVIVYDEGAPDDAQAAHIAAWDPARVLGLVAGARKLLELHQPTRWGRCHMCAWSDGHHSSAHERWPCPTILAVAEMLGVEVPEPAQEGRHV